MKKLMIISTVLVFCSCSNKKETKDYTFGFKSPLLILDTNLYVKSIENVPSVHAFMTDLRKEIPQYFQYAKYLSKDSAKGISIDFIGMMHGTMFNGYPDGLVECQDEIFTLLSEYDFLGCEGFTDFGIISKDAFIQQQIYQFKRYYPDKVDTTIVTYESVDRAMAMEANSNAMIKNLIQTSKIKNIAADAMILGVIQDQLMQDADLVNQKFYAQMEYILTAVRSELAVAKVIAYIRQQRLYSKKVTIVYGAMHMPQFEDIARKLGLKSNFITPTSCGSYN